MTSSSYKRYMIGDRIKFYIIDSIPEPALGYDSHQEIWLEGTIIDYDGDNHYNVDDRLTIHEFQIEGLL